MFGHVTSLSLKPETPGETGLPKQPVALLQLEEGGVRGDFNRYRTQKLGGDPDSAPGRRVRLGHALLEVTRPCDPCTELYGLPYVGQARGPEFVRTLQGRRGWYARVLEVGQEEQGDLVHVPEHRVRGGAL